MTTDHRTVVAAKRREKMRRRLIEAAVLVTAAKGTEGVVIDDITAEADVSRGTFYKYFTTVAELMATAKLTLGEELLDLVLASSPPIEDPAARIAADILSFIATVKRYPLIRQFAAQIGFEALGSHSLAHAISPDYLDRGVSCARFEHMDPGLALDLIQTAVIAVLRREYLGEPVEQTEAVAAILRLLGLERDEAARLARQTPHGVEAPADSLIARSDRIMRARETQIAAPAG